MKYLYTICVGFSFFILVSVFNTYNSFTGDFIKKTADELVAAYKGEPLEEKSTIVEKIITDTGGFPWRFTRQIETESSIKFNQVEIDDKWIEKFSDVNLETFFSKSAPYLLEKEGVKGFLLEVLLPSKSGYVPHLVIMDSEGKIKKINQPETKQCDCSNSASVGYLQIIPWGRTSDWNKDGNSLIDYDFCAKKRWELRSKYQFHHFWNNDVDEKNNNFWILDSTDLVKVDRRTGVEVKRISLSDIIKSNSDLSIFEPRLKRTRWERWTYEEADFVPVKRKHAEVTNADIDPFHTNNIEEYTGPENGLFKNGDLLLSFRSLNLVVVVRPENKKIVWFTFGLTSRQHDPDFLNSTTIMVYDNNFHNRYSKIVEIEALNFDNEDRAYGSQLKREYKHIGEDNFQQLTGGSQFLTPNKNILVFPAHHFIAGIDRETEKSLFAIRARVKSEEDRFMRIRMIGTLSSEKIKNILSAKCK